MVGLTDEVGTPVANTAIAHARAAQGLLKLDVNSVNLCVSDCTTCYDLRVYRASA
jgi:hypothetical protein